MEELPDNMPEGSESFPQKPLEATYVTIVKDIVHKKIPEHQRSFDTALDEINRQITGEGLFQWESKDNPGVKFLAGHLSVTPELIQRIASQNPQIAKETSEAQQPDEEPRQQRLEHYAYFAEPSFGLGLDGSALSALDMGIARFISEMPKVARAIRAGEKPPTVDIYLLGGPTALGAEVTQGFVDAVRANGFSEYGKLYAEFVQQKMAGVDLDKTRIVLQGASKGAITSDQTFANLPSDIQERTQLLYDSPAGTQGQNIPTQIGRSINMGVGMAGEIGIRTFAGSVKGGAFAGQKEFYRAISKAKGIPEDSEEQKKLKGELFMKGELLTIAKGTPLDENQRSFSRISTPDPTNINFRNMVRVVSAPVTERLAQVKDKILGMELKPRRALTAKQNGKRLTFATGNTVHNFPWVRSIDSGSWAQKMEYVENSAPSSAIQTSHS